MRLAAIVALALAGMAISLAVAGAQPRPPRVQPSQDVVVTYRVEGEATRKIPGGLPGPVRLSWDAAGQRVRAETEGRSQVALIDLRGHTGQAIDTTLRVVLPLPIRPADLQPLTLENARLVPQGRETIAGLACTSYRVETGRVPGTVCLTQDGVPLRGQGDVGGRPGSFVALAVAYGRLPPGLFVVPSGYMALDGGGSAGGLAGMAGKLDLKSLGQSLGLGRMP